MSEQDYIQIIQAKDDRISQLEWELKELKRAIFGSKSERFVPTDPGQLSLEIDTVETQAPSIEEVIEVEKHERRKEKEKKHPIRAPFPAHIPRVEEIIVPEGDLSNYKEIGEEITEVLELTEAKVFVKRIIRKKFAPLSAEGAVLIGELPACVIEKGLFGQNLIAQLLIDKYVDHLPIYRQQKRFEREGIKLAYSTLADVPRQVVPLLMPLYELLKKEVIASTYIQADETPQPVLDRETKDKTHRGYFWVYRSPEKRLVLFDYRPGRGRDGPTQILKNFHGFLQTDGYSVYDTFEQRTEISLVGCMAHARRYFEKAKDYDAEKASHVLSLMQKVYATERQLRESQSRGAEILETRNTVSRPVLNELETWMKEHVQKVPPQTPLGKAIMYSLARWEKLTRYLDHAILEIDNNLVENEIRPVVIGRKNYLFAGSHEGAQRSAIIYSFMGSCKINNINPSRWLADVLIKVKDIKPSKMFELLPSNWKSETKD